MVQKSPQTQQVSWLRGLDGLRGIACMTIINAHVITFLIAPGYVAPALVSLFYVIAQQGLTMFFVMSGLLLYRPFAKAVLTGSRLPDTRDYYTSRVLRIFPANAVILVVAGLIVGTTVTRLLPGTTQAVEIGRMTDPLQFLANLFLIQGFFPSTVLTGLSVSWSLVTELVFYIVLPLLGYLAYRLSRRVSGLAAALAPGILLIAIGSVFRQIGYAQQAHDNTDFGPTWITVLQRSFLANCDAIGWGMVVAAFIAAVAIGGDNRRLIRVGNVLAWVAIWVGLVMCAIIRIDGLITPWAAVAWAGILAKMTLPSVQGLWSLTLRICELRPVRYLGEISYSVYMWHFMVIIWFRFHADDVRYDSLPSLGLLWLVMASISVALGSLTFYLVEAPAMRRAKHMAHRRNAVSRVRTTEEPDPDPDPTRAG